MSDEIVSEPKPFASPRRKKSKDSKKTEEASKISTPKIRTAKNSEDVTKSPKNNEETTKSSNKPQLKIVRNNLGSLVIAFFGILGDVVLLTYFIYVVLIVL